MKFDLYQQLPGWLAFVGGWVFYSLGLYITAGTVFSFGVGWFATDLVFRIIELRRKK